jgi:hypothetical protein
MGKKRLCRFILHCRQAPMETELDRLPLVSHLLYRKVGAVSGKQIG